MTWTAVKENTIFFAADTTCSFVISDQMLDLNKYKTMEKLTPKADKATLMKINAEALLLRYPPLVWRRYWAQAHYILLQFICMHESLISNLRLILSMSLFEEWGS